MTNAITPDEVSLWSRLIQENCGVYLDQAKGYLLTNRLQDLLKETGSTGFSELYYKVRGSEGLKRKVVDAITTNETSFFRDTAPFELLRHKLIPDLIDRRAYLGLRPIPLRIWSAACSTGQEVYTLAIILHELAGATSNGYDIRILGTDISSRAVATASRGQFGDLEIKRGLPGDLLNKYFTKQNDGWRIRDEIRALATFRTMNLLQPFSFPAPFDLVLCRNVAIYFREEHRAQLFRNIGRCMAKDGALIVGSTESLAGLCPEFLPRRYLRAIYYEQQRAM